MLQLLRSNSPRKRLGTWYFRITNEVILFFYAPVSHVPAPAPVPPEVEAKAYKQC